MDGYARGEGKKGGALLVIFRKKGLYTAVDDFYKRAFFYVASAVYSYICPTIYTTTPASTDLLVPRGKALS